MKRFRNTAVAVAILFSFAMMVSATASGKSLEDILGNKGGKIVKGLGLAVLTVALADQLDDFINTITLNKGVPTHAETKVVPVLSLGSGTRVGAAQVTGPKDLVDKTKIVVQIETKFSQKNLDVEIFVPSDSMNPLEFNRVEGVGVSALIDLKLSGL